jgi:hypothetical protein
MDRQSFLASALQRVDGQGPGTGLPKHRKMTTSPFVFLRGAAQVFYADLASGTLSLPDALYELPLTCVMGDCHVSNFGFLTEEGSHGDRVIFAANDFDDACHGHAAWDLARFGLSLLLCAEHCRGQVEGRYPSEDDVSGKPAVSADQAVAAVEAFLAAYADTFAAAEAREHHEQVFDHFDKSRVLGKRYRKAVKRAFGGADFMHKSALAKAVDLESLPLRFRDRPERCVRLSRQEQVLWAERLRPYMDDTVLDLVERIGAGTGSHNMRRFYLLVGPAEIRSDRDLGLCHVVEVKQQRQAAPLHDFPDLSPNNRLDPAHLTVVCQRRMQRDPDLLLDEAEWDGAHWLIRSRHHARVGIDPKHIAIGSKAVDKGGFGQYAEICGRVLALTHARADRRSTRFEQQAHRILPGVTRPLVDALRAYAEVVEQDRAHLAGLEA